MSSFSDDSPREMCGAEAGLSMSPNRQPRARGIRSGLRCTATDRRLANRSPWQSFSCCRKSFTARCRWTLYRLMTLFRDAVAKEIVTGNPPALSWKCFLSTSSDVACPPTNMFCSSAWRAGCSTYPRNAPSPPTASASCRSGKLSPVSSKCSSHSRKRLHAS